MSAFRNVSAPRAGEHGQAAVEFGGVLLLIALVLAALLAAGLPGQISGAIARSVDAALAGRGQVTGAGPAARLPRSAGSAGTAGSQRAANGSPSGAPVALSVAAGGPPGGQSRGSGNRGSQGSRLPSGGQRPYVPPKGAHDKPQPVRGGGFKDAYGNTWKWDKSGHGGPHWDVEHQDGSHTNVAPDGTVIGKDNFPNKAPHGSRDGGDSGANTAKKVAGGAAIVGGGAAIIWWGAKLLSPACGPAVLACAIGF